MIFLVLSAWVWVVFWGVPPRIHYQKVCFWLSKGTKKEGVEKEKSTFLAVLIKLGLMGVLSF